MEGFATKEGRRGARISLGSSFTRGRTKEQRKK